MYILTLSVTSELLAFSAIGLIARWGEVFPRWIPHLRGRRVPTEAAVIPAALGATVLTLMFTVLAVVNEIQGTTIRGDDRSAEFPGEAGGWEAAWFYICYTPLILWGPLLAVLTVAYYKRRRRTAAPCGSLSLEPILVQQDAPPCAARWGDTGPQRSDGAELPGLHVRDERGEHVRGDIKAQPRRLLRQRHFRPGP
ncbi:hypothetical protein ACN24M_28985 [Streptomyces microflavus]|uniref:hypothetical protein n=1 Tax=Streptomyces TaxID=1883 RepID=UPI0039814CE8